MKIKFLNFKYFRYSSLEKVFFVVKKKGFIRKSINILFSKMRATFRLEHFPKTYPTQVSIEVASICNFACPGCPHGFADNYQEGAIKATGVRPKFIDYDNFCKIIDELHKHTWFISLTGTGESFLHPRIYDMLHYASSKGMTVTLESNASIFNVDKLLDCGIDTIHLALDGFTKESYEKYRVKGDFDKVLSNIVELCNKISERKSNLKVLIRYLINSYNEDEVEAAEKFFEKYPFVKFYKGEFFVPRPTLEFFNKHPYSTTPELHEEWAPKKRKEFDIYQYDEKNNIYKPKSLFRPITDNCIAVYVGSYINSDGKLYPCCLAGGYEAEELSLGNVFEEGFMNVWYGEKALAFRQKYKENKGNYSFCSICPENTN